VDDKKLERSLNSIGKACFVNHYELFRDKSCADVLFVVDFLVKNEQYTNAGAQIRVSDAKAIFNAGRQVDALKIIVQSQRLPQESVDKARQFF